MVQKEIFILNMEIVIRDVYVRLTCNSFPVNKLFKIQLKLNLQHNNITWLGIQRKIVNFKQTHFFLHKN